jgi:hypothetical protein
MEDCNTALSNNAIGSVFDITSLSITSLIRVISFVAVALNDGYKN